MNLQKIEIKKIIYIILSIVTYIFISNLSLPEGLTKPGLKAIALMLSGVILWATEAIPLTITSLLLPMLTGILGIAPVGETLKGFMNTTIIFMASAQLIAFAFTESGLGKRLALKLSFIFGNKPRHVLLSFMLFTCVISMFLVDIPTAIIFSGLAVDILQRNDCKPGESNFGKSIMMGIPIAAAIGGFGTPVGSGLNILTISLLEKETNVSINFLQWSMIGIPVAIVLVLIAWLIISKMTKAEMEIVKGSENISEEMEMLGPLTVDEKKFITIFIFTAILWATQPITNIDNTLVSCFAAAFLSLTGINLIKWDKARTFVGWEGLFLVGSSTAIALLLVVTGASAWLGDVLLQSMSRFSPLVVIFLVITVGIFSHIPLPVGGAMVALMVPIVAQLAISLGMNPIYLVLPLGFTVSCVFLIPLDPIPLTTFNYKYWKMGDMIKVGFIVSLAWIALLTIAMVIAYQLNIFG